MANSELDVVIERQDAYKRLFTGPIGQTVLDDLAVFCRAEESCFHADPRIHAVLEGRREVWLRIQKYMNLDASELLRRRDQSPTAAE